MYMCMYIYLYMYTCLIEDICVLDAKAHCAPAASWYNYVLYI
jgi:hypothetical protein